MTCKTIQTLVPWELHAHTSPASACGHLSARETVRQIAQTGCKGVVITDHYNPERFDGARKGKAFERELRFLFGGFRDARAAGRELGVTVLCASELRITAGMEDYLLFGMTEQIALEAGFIADLSLAEARRILSPRGVLIVQAHPFRRGQRAADPALLDGVEVFNGNPRHDSHNDLALAYAREHGLLMTRGSDVHQSGDAGAATMLLPPVSTEAELVAALKEYAHE